MFGYISLDLLTASAVARCCYADCMAVVRFQNPLKRMRPLLSIKACRNPDLCGTRLSVVGCGIFGFRGQVFVVTEDPSSFLFAL